MRFRDTSSLLRAAFREWRQDKASRLAAALSFYSLFALVPLFTVIIGVVGAMFGRAAVEGRLLGELAKVTGPNAASAVQAMLANTQKSEGSNEIAIAIGGAVLVVVASALFLQVQDALNTVWHVQPKQSRGWRRMVKNRFVAFGMLALVAMVLMAAILLSAGLAAFGRFVPLLGDQPWLTPMADLAISLVLLTCVFALVFRVLPDARIGWADVWFGGLVTAFLFTVGKVLLGIYFGLAHVASTYGSVGALMLVFLWVYYSAQIFLFGAELTKVRAERFGGGIKPDTYAETVVPVGHGRRAQRRRPS